MLALPWLLCHPARSSLSAAWQRCGSAGEAELLQTLAFPSAPCTVLSSEQERGVVVQGCCGVWRGASALAGPVEEGAAPHELQLVKVSMLWLWA